MAQNQIGDVNTNFTNSLEAPGQDNDLEITTPLNYTSIAALKSALKTFDATTYSDAQLDIMSVNDMVFALRSVQDPKTIANYVVAQTVRP